MHQIPQSPPLSPHLNVPVPRIYPESDIMLDTEDDFLPKQQTAKPPSRGASKYKQKSMIQIQEDLKRRSSMQLSVGAWKVVNGKPVAPDESDSPIKKVEEKHDGSEEEQLKEGEEGEKGRDFGLGGKPWHLLPVKRLLKTLDSTMEGLSSEENEERIKKYGLNRITPPKQIHWFVKFLINLVAGFQLMLWAGAIMCFVVYGISNPHDIQSLALAIVLILVVLLTTIFQSYQESQSDNVMKALKALSASKCFVFRDGGLIEVDAESLVPGDIVSVKAGEKVPADLRVISASDLKVNNASLTGENIDIKLGPDANHKELYEAKNIARSGCVFTCGHGLCIVFATGDNTFFGSIAKSTVSIKRPDTCLKREIKRLIHIMAIVAFTIGITFLILALTSGYPPIEAVIFMIGIIVANVPEGLLPQMTVALTLTAKRMLRKGVLVTNLEIIETLGATTVICSDKTGTLTCNRMSVSHLVYDKEIHSTPITPVMSGDNFKMFDTRDEHFIALQKIATLNCDAVFLSENENVLNRDIKGDASEGALIKFVHPLQDIYEYRLACPRVFAIPFNSSNKWMCSINVQGVNKYSSSPKKNLLLMLKGAPEKIIAMCSTIYHKGEIHNIDENGRKELENTNEALAKRGERVLAFAQLELDNSFHEGFAFQQEPPNFPLKDLTFVGFISLIDPPRMTVKPAINDCYTAGIKVFMVTGDHPITAHAIAKSLNLITYPTQNELKAEGKGSEIARAAVVHGTELAKFSQGDWDELLKHEQIVFARTMPQQKQDIVSQLNKLKHIVAMTGDGVNDAPALKAANVGIAMGSGAAVAKEAAQIILLNDDFGSIVDGIKEGRLIFENLKKCISYVLTSNIPELIPFLLFIAAKIPLAIETIMILCIDLGTDLAPAVALAYEEPESLIMNVPPRKPTDHLVGPHLMFISYCILGAFQTFGAFFAFYYVFYDNGFTVDDLFGVGPLFKLKYSDFDDGQKRDLLDLCLGNNFYIENYLNPSPDRTCQNDIEEFKRWCEGVISIAQSAFFITVVWCQIGAIINRKTQVASSLTYNRFFGNPKLFIAVLIELVIMFSIVYIPGLNNALLFDTVKAKWAACGLWILPFFILWDETRKYLCRRDPNGWMMKYSNF